MDAFGSTKSVELRNVDPGPHFYTFVGGSSGARVNFDAGECSDHATKRHLDIEKCLRVFCDYGACLSFLNAG